MYWDGMRGSVHSFVFSGARFGEVVWFPKRRRERSELWLIDVTKGGCETRTYLWGRGNDGQVGRLNSKGQLLRKEEREDYCV